MEPALRLCPWPLLASGIVESLPQNRHSKDSKELTECRFAEAVIKAAKGEKGVVEPTFVYLPGVAGGEEISKATGVEFFSTPVELGVSYPVEKCRPPLVGNNANSINLAQRRREGY